MKKTLLVGLTFFAFSAAAFAQLSINNASQTYLIDFDNTVSGVNNGTFSGAGFQPSPGVGQLNSNAWAVTGWNDGPLAFGGTQTGGDYARGTASAPVSTGGMYGFSGGNITTGVALGFQPGGNDWAPGTLTLRIQNNSSQTLSSLSLSYIVYVRNDQARSNSFNFSYSLDDSTFSSVPSLDLVSGTAADTNGFVANNRATTLSGFNIAPGQSIYVRWSGNDVAGSGSRDEFGLDNIMFVIPEPSTYASLLMGGGFLVGAWRIRRKSRV